MFATIFAVLISIALFLRGVYPDPQIALVFSLVFGTAILSLSLYVFCSTLYPLQQGEQNMTPRLVTLFYNDSKFRFLFSALFVIPLLIVLADLIPLPGTFLITLILTGIGLDLLFILSRRTLDYLNPFKVVEFLQDEGFQAVEDDQDAKLCEYIESVSQVANKALEKQNSSLTNQAIDSLENMGEKFLASVKSISHPTQNSELQSQGIPDTISYVTLFLLQHLESIHARAVSKNSELVAGHVITTLSKLAAYSAKVDLTLVPLSIHYLKKLTLVSMDKGQLDVGVKASIGLMELTKDISQVKDIAYQELKVPMITLITTLEEIAKETFKKDKKIKIQILMDPFIRVAQILEQEPLKSHVDTPFLMQQINRILGEFQALEAVLKTMPPMPNISPEQT